MARRECEEGRCHHKYHCAVCGDGDRYMAEYYSFGVYAGRYCSDQCWKNSGYVDADDPDSDFDPMDAGESMDPDYGPCEEGW